ncbi:MAG: hypothetical protein EU549_02980 [Promethearchaeota archaeon]|nr:MAG: hypothetical protein EU549_02980 [Candidatus Lokiarchaeota archaeon]
MLYLNLSYFNTIKGPQVFCTVPEGLEKSKAQDIANLLNISELIKQKFFVYDISDFKTVNHYFEVSSEWARGKKEMLILSIIAIDESVELDQDIEKTLEKIVDKIKSINNAYMGFYAYDWGKAEDYDDVDENNEKIKDIIADSYKLIENVIIESREKKAGEVIKSIEPKDLGTYIMDSNFFENLYRIERNKSVFQYLKRVIKDGIKIYISEGTVLDIKLPDEILNTFLPSITIYHVPSSSIKEFKRNKIESRLVSKPSLISLLVLSNILYKNKKNRPITIVSNDYKLNRFVKSRLKGIKVLPTSSFLLEIINALKNRELRDFFQILRKKVMDFEMENLFQTERNISNPKEHLTWLIEKAIGVAGRSIIPTEQEDIDEKVKFKKVEASLINLFIQGVKLAPTQLKSIEIYIPFLKKIAKSNKILNEIQMNLVRDEMQKALKKIHSIISELTGTFLLSGADLEFPENIKFQTIICKSLANFEFLASICHSDLNELDQSIEHLSRASTFSLLANRPNNVIISHYLESLTLVYSKKYEQALKNFEITSKLSEKYDNQRYLIMSLGGKAISQFLQGSEDGAKQTMAIVNNHIKKNKDEAIIILNEFGDSFYNMSRPDIAIHFYNEAIEISVALGNTNLLSILFSKLKKCFYSIGSFNMKPLTTNLRKVTDSAYDLTDERSLEIYNREIAKLGEIQRLLHEPFPFLTNNRFVKGVQLDESLLNWMDILHVKINRGENKEDKHTDFFCFHSELGGTVIRIPEEVPSRYERIPEIYKISLKNGNEKYKIIKPSEEFKDKYLVRAIIFTNKFDNIILKRMFSPIFGKFFEP